MTQKAQINEPARQTDVVHDCDVVVCGGGPAGVAAALSAARSGAKTTLIELAGCIGGVWTSGSLSFILDYENKSGIQAEILDRLTAMDARANDTGGKPSGCYDVEAMKYLLEIMCLEASIHLRYHTRIVQAQVNAEQRLTHVVTESNSGREAWAAKVFIDCTGNGDVGALAGCGFDMGHPESGLCQPMSLIALFTGVDAEAMLPFLETRDKPWIDNKRNFYNAIIEAGAPKPSYDLPSIFPLPRGFYMMMASHSYGASALDADAITQATIDARREIFGIMESLRRSGGVWKNLQLASTANQIGIREGRRLHGEYQVTKEDLIAGERHEDAVCEVTFCVDIHSLDPNKGKGLGDGGIKTQPYDIPLRALIAKDVKGLLMAGRCISGDFYAHASYRVTGNAVAMGEGAGKTAAAICISAAN